MTSDPYSSSLQMMHSSTRATHYNIVSRTDTQSQIHHFPKEGARFRVKCHVDAIQWGGGVVAEIFLHLNKPMRFSGGGVVAEIFRGPQKPTRFGGGGGVVAQNFSFP